MSAKSLLQKIKSIFGLSGAGRETETGPSSDGDDATSVTVEREPDTASEDAVKGTETEEDGDDGADEPVETETTEAEMSETDETTDEGGSESVESIKGIGPTYRDRLEDAGLGTVADLAASDAETVADAAETSESRAADWVERAQER
jgi:polyhydroxyalkanoate synthase